MVCLVRKIHFSKAKTWQKKTLLYVLFEKSFLIKQDMEDENFVLCLASLGISPKKPVPCSGLSAEYVRNSLSNCRNLGFYKNFYKKTRHEEQIDIFMSCFPEMEGCSRASRMDQAGQFINMQQKIYTQKPLLHRAAAEAFFMLI